MPNNNFNAVLFGKTGCGKSCALYNIIRIYKRFFPIHNRWIISPTIDLDDTLREEFDDDQIFRHYSDEIIDHIIETVAEDKKRQEEDILQKAKNRLMKQKRFAELEDDSELPKELVTETYEKMYKKMFKHENYILICEDLQGQIKGNYDQIAQFCSRSRHYHITCIFTFQNYRQCPNVIRQNARVLIFFNQNDVELKKIEEEHSTFKKKGAFSEMFRDHVKGYDFLFVNYFQPPKDRFYKNFSHKIDVDRY